MRAIAALLLIVTSLNAEPKPFSITGQCSAEVIQSQSLTCTTEDPCPLYLELASAEQVATRMFLTGNIHTASQTLQSVLLVSEDAGRSWNEAYTRIPGAVLNEIQFLDFEAGWVSGHILQATPKDAFLLLSTDGGRNWRRRPVNAETRTGAIDQFWFDSRAHGLLTIDRVRAAENGFRYELWESMTGGESWNVRQIDRNPIAFPRPARESPFRIQPDKSGKTQTVERRDGARWTPVSTFETSAGDCKPPAEPVQALPSQERQDEAVQPEQPRPSPRKPPSLRRK